MTYKFHTRLDLINGGNIFRQDDKITLGYIARNANGEALDFSGKEIMGTIYNRRAGIMYEAEASFDADSQKIIFTITQTLDHGTFEIEFVVTDPGNVNYRVVVPSDEYSGRLDIKPSSANIEVTGVRMVTVEQLRSEQQSAQSTYEEKVDGKVQQLEIGFTNHKNAVDLVVEDVQQKASAAETATQTANDAASTANNAASSANTAASSANEQAGAAQQAATDATTASTAANSSADRANTAANNAEGIVDEFGTYKDSAVKAKTFGTVNERFEDLESDTYLAVRNEIVNGDFSNGANSWSKIGGHTNMSVENGKLYLNGIDAIYGGWYQDITASAGSVFYLSFKHTNNGLHLPRIAYYDKGAFTNMSALAVEKYNESHILTSKIGGIRLYIQQQGQEYNATFDDFMLINLTKLFGAGNEPTKEQMDALLLLYPSNLFDGTVNLVENKKLMTFLLNQLRGKANKKQEAWITPTLLNGWIATDTVAYPVGYYKDEFGIVRLRGRIQGGTGSAFIFPVGYRSKSIVMGFVGQISNTDVTGRVVINSQGHVSISSNLPIGQGIYLDGITYKAEG
ncbi:hypothetical protein R0K17_05700 [Planococcus sp. SIMBA_143]